jgi:hypothetical protein
MEEFEELFSNKWIREMNSKGMSAIKYQLKEANEGLRKKYDQLFKL